MTDPALSALIREVLSEELAKLRPNAATHRVKREAVKISSDADLNAFVRSLLKRMDDPAVRNDLETGRLEFVLDGKGAIPTNPPRDDVTAGTVHRVEHGFLSERQIDRLPSSIKRVMVSKAVRLTPLARDRARQRGIVIERSEP